MAPLPAPRRTIAPTTTTVSAPMRFAGAKPTSTVTKTETAPAFSPVLIDTSIGHGRSDGKLKELTLKQRAGNKAVNNRLVELGVLKPELKNSETWTPESTKALFKVLVENKPDLPDIVSGKFGTADNPRAFLAAPPRRADGTRPISPNVPLGVFNAARPRKADPVTEPTSPGSVSEPTGVTQVTDDENPLKDQPVATKPTPAAAEPKARFQFPDGEHDLENWEGQKAMRNALGIGHFDNREKMRKIDATIVELKKQLPTDPAAKAQAEKHIEDLCKTRERLANQHGQRIPEGIRGGINAWKAGRGWEGVGEIISGGIQVPAAAVLWGADGLSRSGGFLRDWARAKRTELQAASSDGEISGFKDLGLGFLEGAGSAIDFAFNFHDAKWYQWLLPTMWLSGAAYAFGKVAVFVADAIIGNAIEALFDAIQGWRGTKKPKASEKERLEYVIEKTREEIARMEAVQHKNAAQEAYLQALKDLRDARINLLTMLNPKEGQAKVPDALIREQRDVVNAWRQFAESLRGPAGAKKNPATAEKVDMPKKNDAATASATVTVSARPPARSAAPVTTTTSSNPPIPTPAEA